MPGSEHYASGQGGSRPGDAPPFDSQDFDPFLEEAEELLGPFDPFLEMGQAAADSSHWSASTWSAYFSILFEGERIRRQTQTFPEWEADCLAFFRDKQGRPFPQPSELGCSLPECLRRQRQDPYRPLLACQHTVTRFLHTRPGGVDRAWLRKFRLQWHPDRFSADGVRGTEKQEAAEEMFKILDALVQR